MSRGSSPISWPGGDSAAESLVISAWRVHPRRSAPHARFSMLAFLCDGIVEEYCSAIHEKRRRPHIARRWSLRPPSRAQRPWSDDLIGYLRSNRVAELELNQAKGWRGADFSFLTLMPDLLSLEILDLAIKDIHHIHVLRGLRRLGITTYCGTPIDFGQFQQLESCGLEWRAGAESVFGCQSLRKLFINRFDGTDLSSLSGLPRLESLAVLNCPLKTLRGIESVRGLTSLRLGGLTRLTSLAGVEALLNLEELEVHTCRQIGSIDHVGAPSRATAAGIE